MAMQCRGCGREALKTFIDLGVSPLANSFLSSEALCEAETFYPLHVRICTDCLFVQLPALALPEQIFGEYAYFSSYSDTWLRHAKCYAERAVRDLNLSSDSFVVEVASNDGYLLQYVAELGVPVCGIEPARNVAEVARKRGVETEAFFLGAESARSFVRKHGKADLVIANNVLAHVPDLHDFVEGLAILLKDGGMLSVEFPHLLRLIERVEFDTIYHEHFSYLSLYSLEPVLAAHGLSVTHVETLETHGGSLRLWITHESAAADIQPSVEQMRTTERVAQLDDLATYGAFANRVAACKRAVIRFLIDELDRGMQIAGYGAAAKGNTLMNYCGITPDMIPYVADRNPHKIGKYLPGSRIPVVAPRQLIDDRPDIVMIIPWNIRDEIVSQLRKALPSSTRFVVPLPSVEVVS
jgi:SAM-dependent methyltransferase